MGVWFHGQCVASDHAFRGINPWYWQAPSYIPEYRQGSWRISEYQNDWYHGGSTYIRSAVIPLAGVEVCDEWQPLYDGLAVGWQLAVLLVGVWGVRRCLSVLRR